MMNKYAAELLGTFALVLAGTGAIIINDLTGGTISHIGIAFTFGLVVMAMVYALGDISGAHLNPAVTFGFWVTQTFPGRMVLPYILSQCAGALSASLLLRLLFVKHPTLGGTFPAGSVSQSFILEAVLTFLLMFVILNIAAGEKGKGLTNGAAIGAVITLEALFAGPITGASMNPARSLGPALVTGNLNGLWIYLTAPVLGAYLAHLGCRYVRGKGCCRITDEVSCQ
ncbi:MAG: aquaporin [Nitrospira sp.]|nr:aquaporin [Nitrospira sp.]